jgi:hypothetical protein
MEVGFDPGNYEETLNALTGAMRNGLQKEMYQREKLLQIREELRKSAQSIAEAMAFYN